MNSKVIYIGDTELVDYPFILSGNEWIIPFGWYLLDNELEDRPTYVYKISDNVEIEILIKEHVQIRYDTEIDNYKLSIIKTNKPLNFGDILKIKK
jgi:hypothetical protein